MTLGRVFLIVGVAIGLIFAVLAFGNPQWHKRIFMFQYTVYPNHLMQSSNGRFPVPEGVSEWKSYTPEGKPDRRELFLNGELIMMKVWVEGEGWTTVFDGSLDHRAEFGIPVK